ncbi:hypothetical protein AAMO2058_000889100, partial [Amorphochlora amoebiformis]
MIPDSLSIFLIQNFNLRKRDELYRLRCLGTYSNSSGQTSESSCTPCWAGYYCPNTGQETMETAFDCPQGHYCPAGTFDYLSFPCPAGTYSDQVGLTAENQCTACPAGQYCVSGSTTGKACPAGYYCPSGTTASCYVHERSSCMANETQPCPAGTYSGYRVGLDNVGQCNGCPKGSYCPEASVTPIPCVEGTYNNQFNISSVLGCTNCPMGMACPNVGTIFPSVNCSTGHYCPGGTVYPDDHPCPAGTYSSATSNQRIEDCLECPAGYACDFGTGGDMSKFQSCSVGYYCPAGTKTSTQFSCPPGTYGMLTSLKSSDQCERCPRGFWCKGDGWQPEVCAAGYYCPEGSTENTTYPCPAGTYAFETSLWREEQCIECPVGYYCGAATTNPQPCAAGTYSDDKPGHTLPGPSLDGWPACRTCPDGHICPNAMMTSPIACGKGYYSASNSVSCTQCEVGYFCEFNATSEAVKLVSPCPTGMFCPAGTSVRPALDTHKCTAGFFCPQGTTSMQACPITTYLPREGGQSINDCLTCPAGYYCESTNQTTVTGVCLQGYYCPEGSYNNTAVACPVGTYRSTTGATNLTACSTCPPGFYCPTEHLVDPIICPQ